MTSSRHIKKYTIATNKGFSLIELVIVIGILAGIVGLVGAFQSGIFRMNRIFGGGIDMAFEGNQALKDFLRTVRPLAPSVQGAYPIETAGTSTFTFFSDVDSNGTTERVRYFLASTTLKKGVIVATGNPPVYVSANEVISSVVHNVQNTATTSVFTYFDRNYVGSTTPLASPVKTSDVRLVHLYLVIDANPGEPPSPLVMETNVTFRNLKDNQ